MIYWIRGFYLPSSSTPSSGGLFGTTAFAMTLRYGIIMHMYLGEKLWIWFRSNGSDGRIQSSYIGI